MSESTDDAPTGDETRVLYRRISDEYQPSDGHERLDEEKDEWVCNYDAKLENLEGAGMIEVLQWDFDPNPEAELTGPPEPVIDEDGMCWLFTPTEANGYKKIQLGKFRCVRCETLQGEQISRGQEPEPPHKCYACEREGPFVPHGLSGTGMELESVIDPIWNPPTGISDARYSEIWEMVKGYLETYWYTGQDHLYAGLTAFAISSWLRPNFSYLPHLMVMGMHETGKTRLLRTLNNICYRGINPVDASPAAVFRTIDTYNTSFFLSEYHDLIEEKQNEIDTLIKGAQKRGEMVMRTENINDGHVPISFNLFTHVGIGTQFDIPDDTASRCIEIQTRPAGEQMPDLADFPEIREELLYVRFRLHDSDEWDRAWSQADKFLKTRGVKHRLREKMLSLVTVAVIWDKLEEIEPFVLEMADKRRKSIAETEDAIVIQSMMEVAFDSFKDANIGEGGNPWHNVKLMYSDICEKFEELSDKELTPSKLGHIIKRFPLERDRSRAGTFIQQPDLGSVLKQLADENNLDWKALANEDDEFRFAPEPSQDEVVTAMLDIIDELASVDDPAPRDEILDAAEERNIDREKADHRIGQLRTEGHIIEPDPGHFRRV